MTATINAIEITCLVRGRQSPFLVEFKLPSRFSWKGKKTICQHQHHLKSAYILKSLSFLPPSFCALTLCTPLVLTGKFPIGMCVAFRWKSQHYRDFLMVKFVIFLGYCLPVAMESYTCSTGDISWFASPGLV